MPTVRLGAVAVVVGLCLPVAGLLFLLRPDYAAVQWTSPPLHFVFFLVVGSTTASLPAVGRLVAGGLAAHRRHHRGRAQR